MAFDPKAIAVNWARSDEKRKRQEEKHRRSTGPDVQWPTRGKSKSSNPPPASCCPGTCT